MTKNHLIKKELDPMWIALFCIIVFFTLQFAYNDCVVLLRSSVNFWHALFDGIPMNFYQYGRFIEKTTTLPYLPPQGAAYPFLSYIPTAIWSFPLYLLERFANVNLFANAWAVMYLKLGLLLVSCVNAFLIRKILRKLGCNEIASDAAPMLYLSAGMFFTGTVAIGQLEAVTILPMLLGFRSFYQRKTAQFIAFFAIAVTFKYFAIFAFIPLLLLYEKNLLKIVRNGVLAVLPTLLVFLITRADINAKVGKVADVEGTIYTESAFLSAWFPDTSFIEFGNGTINLLLIGLIVLCLYCYISRPENRRQLARYGAFAGFVAFLLFVFVVPASNPYWAVLLVPFSVMLLCMHGRDFARNIMIETLAAAALMLWQELTYYHCFGLYALQNSVFLVGRVFPAEIHGIGLQTAFGVIVKYCGKWFLPVLFSGTYCFALVGFGYLAYTMVPGKRTALSLPQEEIVLPRSVLWARILITAGVLMIPMIVVYTKLLML